MLVTSHVLAGATIGTVLGRHPVGAFVAGVASHLLMDACPHWGTDLAAPGPGTTFLRVARCDGCAGLAAMAVVAGAVGRGRRASTVAAMVGAASVDLDKPFRHFFGWNPFPARFQAFHERIQREAPHRLPHEVAVAATLGVVTAAAVLRTR